MNKILSILLLLTGLTAQAATYCVGPSATGSGSGADWSNVKAWTDTPARGDTWYLRDGSYAAKTFSTAASGTTVITIKKATATDHVTSTGWVSSMANQATFGGVDFNSSNWVFDGQVHGSVLWSRTQSDYGFAFVNNGNPIGIFNLSITISNVTVANIWSQGPTATGSEFVATDNQTKSVHDVTISHCAISRFSNAYWATSPGLQMNNWVFEYNTCWNGNADNNNHGEWINNNYGAMTLQVVRYCCFDGPTSGYTGVFVANNHSVSNPRICGNVFANYNSGNGVITGTSGGSISGALVCNNTFYNCGVSWLGNTANSGCTAYDNVLYSMDAGVQSGYTHDYNSFFSCTSVPSESHGQTGSGSPFVSVAGLNFHLLSPTSAGTVLASPYNADPDGNTRGSDGTWDRGAFEYLSSAGVAPSITAQPTATSAQVGGSWSLGVSATGSAPLSYQLYAQSNATPSCAVAGATSPPYTKSNAVLGDSTNYCWVVTNQYGAVTSAVVSVLVTNGTAPVLAVDTLQLQFPTTPTNTTQDVVINISNAGTGTLTGTASASSVFSVVSGGSYSLASGDSQAITVRFTPTSQGQITGTLTLTGGGGTNLPCSGIAYPIFASASIPTFSGVVLSPFAVVGGNSVMQTVDTTTVAGSGECVVGFNLASPANIYILGTMEITNLANNSCFLQIDREPNNSDLVTETNIQAYGSGLVTQVVAMQGSGTPDLPQYPTNVWSLAAGNHWIAIRGREANTRFGTLTVVQTAPPNIVVDVPDAIVSAGQTATFAVTANGTPTLTYQWAKNGSNITGATQASYTVPATVVGDDGSTFAVTVANTYGSAVSRTATLSVKPALAVGTMSATRLVTPKLTFGP